MAALASCPRRVPLLSQRHGGTLRASLTPLARAHGRLERSRVRRADADRVRIKKEGEEAKKRATESRRGGGRDERESRGCKKKKVEEMGIY